MMHTVAESAPAFRPFKRKRMSLAAAITIVGLVFQLFAVMGFIFYTSDAAGLSSEEDTTMSENGDDPSWERGDVSDYFSNAPQGGSDDEGSDNSGKKPEKDEYLYPQLTDDQKKQLSEELSRRKAEAEQKAREAEAAARQPDDTNGQAPAQQSQPGAPVPAAPAPPASTDGSTSGPGYSVPGVRTAAFNDGAAIRKDNCAVDFSSAGAGYIGAKCSQGGKVKLQIVHGNMSYNYDIPSNGGVAFVPVNMGSGKYKARFMLNTSGDRYVELFSAEGDAALPSELAPYTTPNLFCNYSPSSACVAKARELAGGCRNEGDVVRSVYRWIQNNVTYDYGKAGRLANATGYIPNPDATLSSRSGICFDYASLAAAMFRSLGIPCKLMTGYVSPGNLYHSWNMVYIDGQWVAADITVNPNCWNRVDITFAAAGSVAGGYTDRYTY